jgi:hypothetical protein
VFAPSGAGTGIGCHLGDPRFYKGVNPGGENHSRRHTMVCQCRLGVRDAPGRSGGCPGTVTGAHGIPHGEFLVLKEPADSPHLAFLRYDGPVTTGKNGTQLTFAC